MRTATRGGHFLLLVGPRFLAGLWVTSVAIACGAQAEDPGDAALDAGADAELEPAYTATLPQPPAPIRAEPAAPAEAAEVALRSWDCPSGWVAVPHPGVLDGDGEVFSHCEPVRPPRLRMGAEVTPLDEGEQEGDRPICDPAVDGTFPILGSADCQPLGDLCPAGTWPEIPVDVTGARLHVLPGAEGGDGSEVAPYGTIVEAVEAAADGDVVVLGAGTHLVATDRRVQVDRRLTLWGACVQRTEVVAQGPFGSHAALVAWQGGQLNVRNVRITGEQFGIIVMDETSRAEIEGVWLTQTTGRAIHVGQGSARIEEVLVTDTTGNGGTEGIALVAEDGADVEVLRSTFERSRWAAALAYSTPEMLAPPTLTLEDLLVRDTLGLQDGDGKGRGLSVDGEATVEVRRALLERSSYRGANVARDCTLDLEDVIVSGTGAAALEGDLTAGVGAKERARITGRRVAILDSQIRGVTMQGEGTSFEAVDVVVARTHGLDPQSNGLIGLAALEGSTARISMALVEQNSSHGLEAAGEGTSLELSDVVVSETLPAASDLRFGYGVVAAADASLRFERLRVVRSHGAGVLVQDARLDGTDLVVTQTAPQASDGEAGLALQASFAARVTVTRARFDASHQVTLGAYNEGTDVVVEDLVVPGTLVGAADTGIGLVASQRAILTVRRSHVASSPSSGGMAIFGGSLVVEDARFDTPPAGAPTAAGGIGLFVLEGASTSVLRTVFDEANAYGVLADGEDCAIRLEDVTVRGTRAHPLDRTGGYGAVAARGATLEVRRAELTGNRACALAAIGPGARVTAEDVTLALTDPQESDGDLGMGLCLEDGGGGELRRASIEDNALSGIGLSDPGTSLTAEDVAILGLSGSRSGSIEACGIYVKNEAELGATRTLVDGVVGVGVGVVTGAQAVLTDLTIRDVLPYLADLAWGRGLHAESGAQVTVTRGLFDGCLDLGVGAFGEGTVVALDSTSILGTRPQACAAQGEPTECPGRGYGLGSYHGAEVQANRAEVMSSAAIGIQLARGGVVAGSEVVVRRSPVGINVQDVDDGFDLGSAVSELRFERCEVEVDWSDLPLPEAWGMER